MLHVCFDGSSGSIVSQCVVPELYPYLPHGRFFAPGISSLPSYIPLKSLAFETPLPLGISNDLPWGRYGYFLELHNESCLFTGKHLSGC